MIAAAPSRAYLPWLAVLISLAFAVYLQPVQIIPFHCACRGLHHYWNEEVAQALRSFQRNRARARRPGSGLPGIARLERIQLRLPFIPALDRRSLPCDVRVFSGSNRFLISYMRQMRYERVA